MMLAIAHDGQIVCCFPQGNYNYLFGDHLGSTSVAYNTAPGVAVTQLYKPWGEVRWASAALPTTSRYTGQREDASIGLYYYGARCYDAAHRPLPVTGYDRATAGRSAELESV